MLDNFQTDIYDSVEKDKLKLLDFEGNDTGATYRLNNPKKEVNINTSENENSIFAKIKALHERLTNRNSERGTLRGRISQYGTAELQRVSGISDIQELVEGIHNEQRGNMPGVSRDAVRREDERLIAAGRAYGPFIERKDWDLYGKPNEKRSGESKVYYNAKNKIFIKFKDPFKATGWKNNSPSDANYEHVIHNLLFPNSRYKFLGISEDVDGVRITTYRHCH